MDKNEITTEKDGNSHGSKRCSQQESDNNIVPNLMNQAFQIDLIREKIISHVIKNGAPTEMIAVRLVQKSWQRDVSKILLKCRKPLYQVNLNAENFLHDSDYVRENGQKILDKFISTALLSSPRIEQFIPPFALSIQKEYFVNENRISFSNFLTGGSTAGLVRLKMFIPHDGGSMDFTFLHNTLSFPMLQELSIQFFEEETNLNSSLVVHGSNSYFVPILQSILHGTNHLKRLYFTSTTLQPCIPNGVQYLSLPESLTAVSFKCVLTPHQLDGLAANSLPNLTHLTLNINHIPFSNSLIFQVLDQYKRTLQTLYFDGIKYQQENIPRDVNYFSFPVMESLSHFSSSSIHAELETHLSSLHAFLPKLKTLWLKKQTVGMFKKWTDGSCFPTVTKLSVELVDENFPRESEYHYLTFRLEEMQLVRKAFSNVTILELHVTGEARGGLEYLFVEMQQLVELKIVVVNRAPHANSHYWDSLLIGVPLHVMETLGSNPQFLDYLSVDIKHDDNLPSIRNLTALRLLHLFGYFTRGADIEAQESFISDAVFNLAFLKMPNLKELHLEGRFMASDEIWQRWEAEQRSIYYVH